MSQQKSSTGTIITTILITALVVGGGTYYFQNTKTEESINENISTNQKSLVEYYETKDQFLNNSMTKDPEDLGFNQVGKIEIACPEVPEGPCGGDLLILSKETLNSGDQEFYLGLAGGVGYSYYGPFTDNLERIVNESKTMELLK